MSSLARIRRKGSAFTLIEVLAVIALIAILASIVAGTIQGVKRRTEIARARMELACLAQALENFKRHYSDYPQSVTEAETSNASSTLFDALVGGWGSDAMTEDAGPVFVELSKLTLESPAAIGSGSTRASNAFIDPWGRRYAYRYRRNEPFASGYLLFSLGPDGATTRFDASTGTNGGTPAGGVNVDDILAVELP